MTYLEAIELSTKLWIWLFKNPGKWKHDSPYREEITGMKSWCPLCEFYWNVGCRNCILKLKNCCPAYCGYKNPSTAYVKCSSNTHRPATARIAAVLRREYERLTGDKEKFRSYICIICKNKIKSKDFDKSLNICYDCQNIDMQIQAISKE